MSTELNQLQLLLPTSIPNVLFWMLTCDIPMGWFTSYFVRTMSFLFPFYFFLFFFFAQAPGKALQHRQVIGVGNQTGTEAFPPQHLPPGAYLFEWRHGKLRGSWSSISPPSPHCFFSLYSHIISFTPTLNMAHRPAKHVNARMESAEKGSIISCFPGS